MKYEQIIFDVTMTILFILSLRFDCGFKYWQIGIFILVYRFVCVFIEKLIEK